MFKRISLILIMLGAVTTLTLAAKRPSNVKVKVLDRARLDCSSEDLEYVPNGPLAGRLVILDQAHVLGMRVVGRGDSKVKQLFDMPDLPVRPNGIAYVEPLQLFVIDSRDKVDTLYFIDSKGKVKFTRTIQYLDDYLPTAVEGLAYIPSSSASYPDHLVLVTLDEFEPYDNHLQIIRLDGLVEKDIVVPQSISTDGLMLGSVTFLPSDMLLVGAYSSEPLFIVDFNGNVTAAPHCGSCGDLTGGFEGLARTPSGLIVGAGSYGKLIYFDEDLNYLPELDQVYAPNLGLVGLRGIAWDSQVGQFLIHYRPAGVPFQAHVTTVPPSLDSTNPLTDINLNYTAVRGLAYLPDENKFAMGFPTRAIAQSSILIYNMDDTDGIPDETVELSGLGLGDPTCLTYIPGRQYFAVAFSNSDSSLTIVNRNGTGVIESVDFAPIGVEVIRSVAFFNPSHPSGGQFLIHAEPGRRVLITDFSLNVLGEFDAYPTLGLTRLDNYYDVVAITSGKYAGAFGMYGDSGELVIFSIK
jgi:hypothetical protein